MPLTCPLVINKRTLSVRLCLFSLSPTCSTCINRAQMNLVWSDGQCTVIWFLIFVQSQIKKFGDIGALDLPSGYSKKSVISTSSPFLSFFYLQYEHQLNSNESGLIRWAVHSDLISGILFIISVNQNVTRSSSNLLFLGTMCDCLENWKCKESSKKQREDRSEWTIMFNCHPLLNC